MSLNCTLLDTLSQIHDGLTQSDGVAFNRFASDWLPPTGDQLPIPIRQWNRNNNPTADLVTFADVLWVAFRCGIVHEAYISPYGMVRGDKLVEFVPYGHTTYTDTGADCPLVFMSPWLLLKDVISATDKYLGQL